MRDLPNITEFTSARLQVTRSDTKLVENRINREPQENMHKRNVRNAIILKKCFIRLKRINAEISHNSSEPEKRSSQQRRARSDNIPETMLQQNKLEKNICKVKLSNHKGRCSSFFVLNFVKNSNINS